MWGFFYKLQQTLCSLLKNFIVSVWYVKKFYFCGSWNSSVFLCVWRSALWPSAWWTAVREEDKGSCWKPMLIGYRWGSVQPSASLSPPYHCCQQTVSPGLTFQHHSGSIKSHICLFFNVFGAQLIYLYKKEKVKQCLIYFCFKLMH